jgi:hypothetical protein
MVIEIVVDGMLELGDRREGASPNAFGCNLGEKVLDEVSQDALADMSVRRMISFVPWPSAVASTIMARQITLALVLRSVLMASSRARSERLR